MEEEGKEGAAYHDHKQTFWWNIYIYIVWYYSQHQINFNIVNVSTHKQCFSFQPCLCPN